MQLQAQDGAKGGLPGMLRALTKKYFYYMKPHRAKLIEGGILPGASAGYVHKFVLGDTYSGFHTRLLRIECKLPP